RRLIFSIFTLIGATIIVFTLSRVVGDPRLLYAQEGGYGLSDQAWDDLGVQLGLDKPLIVQYFKWLGDVVSGDLGQSLLGRVDVSKLIRQKSPATLQLGLVSWVVATLIGVPLGVLSAVKRGSFWDYLGRGFALLGQAAPPFWIGIMAILLFAVRLDWLPAGGRGDGFSGWKNFIMPAGTLGLAASASYLRLTRSAMLEILDSEFVKLARAKGVGTQMVIWKHAFKNALIPPLTLSALILVGFITGTVVVETVFTWPGLGRLAVTSTNENDFPVMTGVVLVFAMMYVVINLITDLTYAVVDPRIRIG
ncbi:MAG: ABC transporter permease, partial [Dehalococcoidia bacterium]|nr:ABC transporter permease [Dehalococcoidia bacterium]